PAGSHHVGDGQQSRPEPLIGYAVGGHERALGVGDADVFGLAGTHELTVHTVGLEAVAAVGARVVRGRGRPDDELPRLHRGHLRSDLLHEPTYSWLIGCGASIGSAPR